MKRFKGELRQPVPEWSARLHAFYATLVNCGADADIQHCFDEHYCHVCGQLADTVCPFCNLYYHAGCLGRTSIKEKHMAKMVKDAYTALTQGLYCVVPCFASSICIVIASFHHVATLVNAPKHLNTACACSDLRFLWQATASIDSICIPHGSSTGRL
jgi:hypothetical protein